MTAKVFNKKIFWGINIFLKGFLLKNINSVFLLKN